MTSEGNSYVYAAPFPSVDDSYPKHILQPTITTGTITFSSTIQCELQMQVEELTSQNDIFMEALLYCISKFSKEEIKNDLCLGLIELATKMKREG